MSNFQTDYLNSKFGGEEDYTLIPHTKIYIKENKNCLTKLHGQVNIKYNVN